MSYFTPIPDYSKKTADKIAGLSRSKNYREVWQAVELAETAVYDYHRVSKLIGRYKSVVRRQFKDKPQTKSRLLRAAEKRQDILWRMHLGNSSLEQSGLAACLS